MILIENTMGMAVDHMPSPTLLKALGAIARHLHDGFDRDPRFAVLYSRQACVLTSLTVRDFLLDLGLRAAVHPVTTIVWAERDGVQLHSAAIGAPHDPRRIDGRWCGHMVVTVEGLLIDTTLYQAQRPAWPDLPGMLAVPLLPEPWQRGWWGLDLMAGIDLPDDTTILGWLDNPQNQAWQRGPDAVDVKRRAGAVKALLQHFETHEEATA